MEGLFLFRSQTIIIVSEIRVGLNLDFEEPRSGVVFRSHPPKPLDVSLVREHSSKEEIEKVTIYPKLCLISTFLSPKRRLDTRSLSWEDQQQTLSFKLHRFLIELGVDSHVLGTQPDTANHLTRPSLEIVELPIYLKSLGSR